MPTSNNISIGLGTQQLASLNISLGLGTQQLTSYNVSLGLADPPDRGEGFFDTAIPIRKIDTEPTEDFLKENPLFTCCFCLPVFGDLSNNSELRNDKTAFLWDLDQFFTGATMVLEKEGAGDVANLNNNALGVLYNFGFEVIDGKNYIGYELDWNLVLLNLGVGSYTVRLDRTDVLGNSSSIRSFGYQLKHYTEIEVDETVRINFINNNLIGRWDEEEEQKSFGSLNWSNWIRLPKSMISHDVSTYEIEETRYEDGTRVDVVNNQEVEYTLYIGKLPYEIHRYIRTEVLQSDEILITDYNSMNPACGVFIDKSIKPTSDYAPNWENNNQQPTAEVKFKLKRNNLRKRLC